MNSLAAKLKLPAVVLYGYGILVLLSCWLAVGLGQPAFLVAPAGIIASYWVLRDFKRIFFLLFFLLPFSTDMRIGSVSIDVPTEPILLLLTLGGVVYFLANFKTLSYNFITHPVTLILLMHIGWIFLTTITSSHLLYSIKFSLAKIWFIIPFYFLATKILNDEKRYRIWLISTLTGIVLTVIYVMVRHAQYGFTFKDINWVLGPFYPNHVMYASVLSVFIPYVWEALGWVRKNSFFWWVLWMVLVLFVVGVKLSYTRAAYISVLALPAMYWLIRLRLMKFVLGIGLIVTLVGTQWVLKKNKYIDFAPDYERTISFKDFGDLMDATVKLEDISFMERVYRWVAAFRMIGEKPLVGFGPGNFYSFYKKYTVRMFKTYVSDNPEKSGVHCYFLMTASEQGIPGLLIFVALIFGVILTGEDAWHRARSPLIRRRIMANLLAFLSVILILLVNDMVETDKIGAFFFLSAALIVRLHLQVRKSSLQQKQ